MISQLEKFPGVVRPVNIYIKSKEIGDTYLKIVK